MTLTNADYLIIVYCQHPSLGFLISLKLLVRSGILCYTLAIISKAFTDYEKNEGAHPQNSPKVPTLRVFC